MLTNKCKTDFEAWLKEQPLAPYPSLIWDVPVFVRNSFILSFFDAAGIYIDTFTEISESVMFGLWVNGVLPLNLSPAESTSREEAQVRGIESANEIYNKRITI